MTTIEVKTQDDLDAIKIDFDGYIKIIGEIDRIKLRYKNAIVDMYGNAQIRYVSGNAQIRNVSDNAQISNVSGNAQIRNVSDNAQIRNVSGNAQIRNVSDNAQISNVYGNAQIRYVSGNAQIRNVSGNAQIRYVSGNAQISNVYGNAQISNVSDNAQIHYVSGNAQIHYVSDNAQIHYVYDNAQISNVYGNAQISNVYDNAQIRNVYGNTQIRNVSDNAQISNVFGLSNVLFVSGNASISVNGVNIISYESDSNVKIKKNNNTTVVKIQKTEIDFNWFKALYPVEIKGKNALLYKAVRKINGEFVSDYNKNFNYVIGEVKKEKCNDDVKEDCSYGIHVSHKMWALDYGKRWDDMALIEVSVPISKIIVPVKTTGKLRTSKIKVLREIPKEEWYS